MILAMPMNGTGQRFLDEGYAQPKPLLDVNGRPMFAHALACYPADATVVLPVTKDLAGVIAYLCPRRDAIIIPLHAATQGPVETLLHPEVLKILTTEDDLLIADCDAVIDPHELSTCVTGWRTSNAQGASPVRYIPGVEYDVSYANINPDWSIVECLGNNPLSDWSTTGPYWWRHASNFLRCAHAGLSHKIVTISPLFNHLIQEGRLVQATPVKTYQHLGTPNEYEAYRALHRRPTL